jgi:alcohol dehydrogenase class IV
MDALTHNMEAYISKNFHPLAAGIGLEGIYLINQSIVAAVNKPSLESRSNMMMASLMGAVAFQKGLGVVHSLAHPLSSLLDTHHGLANAVNLPYGMRFNAPGLETEFKRMALAMELETTTGESVVNHLFDLNQQLGLPVKLRNIGVTDAHIETLSDLAFADFCHPNNPKPVARNDFKQLYLEAL